MKSKPVEFQPPAGFMVPEGTQPGETFDLVCTFRLKADGMICLTQLGDSEMPGYNDNPRHKPDYSEYAQAMMPTPTEE